MKLKILHLAQFIGVGGLEKILFLLIKEQMRAGHEVELVVYDHEQTWVEHFRQHGIKVNSDYRKNKGYDWGLIQWLAQKISNWDIVHSHDLNPLMYLAPLKLISRMQDKRFPRLIHSAHGMDHIQQRPITKVFEKSCSLMTDATVAVAPAVKELYLKKMLLDWNQLHFVPNGTEVQPIVHNKKEKRRWLQQRFKLRSDSTIWVCVARVVPLKNQALLIEAAGMNPHIDLLLLGPSGDDQYWHALQQNKPVNVHMPGAMAEISEILAGADYFVSASRHEGIPVSVLEAGAMGLPCLLSDIPGHRVLQEKSEQTVARYFEVNNLKELVRSMREMEASSLETQQMGHRLHQLVKDHFSSESMHLAYQKIYMKV